MRDKLALTAAVAVVATAAMAIMVLDAAPALAQSGVTDDRDVACIASPESSQTSSQTPVSISAWHAERLRFIKLPKFGMAMPPEPLKLLANRAALAWMRGDFEFLEAMTDHKAFVRRLNEQAEGVVQLELPSEAMGRTLASFHDQLSLETLNQQTAWACVRGATRDNDGLWTVFVSYHRAGVIHTMRLLMREGRSLSADGSDAPSAASRLEPKLIDVALGNENWWMSLTMLRTLMLKEAAASRQTFWMWFKLMDRLDRRDSSSETERLVRKLEATELPGTLNGMLRYELARWYLYQDESERALEDFRVLVDDYPEYPAPYHFFARIAAYLERSHTAAAVGRRIERRFGRDYSWAQTQAYCDWVAGDYQSAHEAYRVLSSHWPQDLEAIEGMLRLNASDPMIHWAYAELNDGRQAFGLLVDRLVESESITGLQTLIHLHRSADPEDPQIAAAILRAVSLRKRLEPQPGGTFLTRFQAAR